LDHKPYCGIGTPDPVALLPHASRLAGGVGLEQQSWQENAAIAAREIK
jgi:hypothetical protein